MKEGKSENEEKRPQTPKVVTFGSKLINRLTMQDLQAIQDAFHVTDAESKEEQLSLTKNQFCDLLGLVINKGTAEEYDDLFDKLDSDKEGFVDWDQLCSHILLECYEKDDRIKTTQVPQWRELKFVYSPHKEVILKVEFLANTAKYCTVSRDGNVCFWNMDLRLARTLQIQANPEDLRQKDLWITSFALMANIHKLAVSLTSKEISIYDLSTKSEFNCVYRIFNLNSTPLCLDYWHNPDNPKQAFLSFADASGSVHVLSFLNAANSLFDRPHQPVGSNRDVCLAVNFQNLVKGLDKKVVYYKHSGHSDWARQIQYLHFLECFVSSSTTSKDSLILASIDKSRTQMRLSTFRITQGINGFDYNETINAIATAGINNHVCLWNPYVISKPIGVLRGHMQSVVVVKFIQNRGQLLSLSKDKVLRVWDTHLQVCLQRLSGVFPKGVDMIISMYYDHDRSRLFTSFNHQLTLMVMKAEVKDKILSHDNPISAVLYNSKFNQVVSVCTGSLITMWMLDTGQKVKQFANAHGKSEITCLAQDSSETKLITGSNDGTLKIWDFNGHCYHVLIAEDGNPCEIGYTLWLKQSLVCVGWEKSICNFPIQQLKAFYVYPTEWRGKQEHKDDILSASFSAPHTLATGSYDGEIVLWNTASENAFKRLVNTSRQKSAITTSHRIPSRGSSDSRRSGKYSSLKSRELRSREEKMGAQLSTSKESGSSDAIADAPSEDASFAVTTLLYLEGRPQPISSKSAANLVSVFGNGQVLFWNTFSGVLGEKFVPHQHSGLIKVATDPKNSILVTGDGDGTCKVWNIVDYCVDTSITSQIAPTMLYEFTPHGDLISCLQVVVRFEKILILTGSSDCSVMLHRINGQLVGVFGQEEHWNIDALVTDEQLVMSGSFENLTDEDLNTTSDIHQEEIVDDPKLASVEKESNYQYDTHYQTWEKTILGAAYKEKNCEKRERRQPFSLPMISSEKGIASRTFKSLSCSELDSIGGLSKPDFMLNPDRYFAEKRSNESGDSVPSLPPIIDQLTHRHDMKSIFPKNIIDMDLKMRAAHAMAFSTPSSGTMFQSALSSPLTHRSSSKVGAGSLNELLTDQRNNRLNKDVLRRALGAKYKMPDKR